MANIWFSSDWHYHHKNLVRGTTEWGNDPSKGEASVKRTRDFSTLEEHDTILVNNINTYAKYGDTIYFLGDFSFGGRQYVLEFAERLKCKNIHLTLGNHDHHIERDREDFQALFSSVQHYSRRIIGGQDMVLMHYSMRTWDKAHSGTWMLYGHSHGTLEEYGYRAYIEPEGTLKSTKVLYKTMDVGIDTHPEFRPYHFDEIATIMKNRVDLKIH